MFGVKKILIVLIVLLFASIAFSQEKYSSGDSWLMLSQDEKILFLVGCSVGISIGVPEYKNAVAFIDKKEWSIEIDSYYRTPKNNNAEFLIAAIAGIPDKDLARKILDKHLKRYAELDADRQFNESK